jgi:virginiamycin B lyase
LGGPIAPGYPRAVIAVARPLRTGLAALIATLACAPAAGAAVTTWPTCPAVPLTGDSALCSSGRSPQGLVAGPDGAVWFTAASGEIGRVTTSGGLSLVPVPGSGTRLPDSITRGPDGALWYVDAFGPTLGRLTTAFAFSTFADTGFHPEGVRTGPDGRLWVVESEDTVSRFGVDGSVTRFPLPAGTTAPDSSIAAGPDGRMWFTGPDSIGAITTAGAVSLYPLPASAGGCPSALATRAGQRIWVADYCRDRVGSVTTGGSVNWLAFPGGGPEAISFGPDGNLWIGLGRSGQVVRMTTAGTVLDVVPLLYGPDFGGIAPGPDGNMWFTEIATPQIGRIDVPGATAAAAAAAPGAVDPPPRVRLFGARLQGGRLLISAQTGEAGTLDGRAALVSVKRVRIRPGRAGLRRRPTRLGSTADKVTPERHTLRLTLSAAARRALARARRGAGTATVEVAVRLHTAGKREASVQRRLRFR